MNDRQMSSRFQPFERKIAGSTVPDTNFVTPWLSFEVASENRVSMLSETRVIDGAASLSAISCIARSPVSKFGKK